MIDFRVYCKENNIMHYNDRDVWELSCYDDRYVNMY